MRAFFRRMFSPRLGGTVWAITPANSPHSPSGSGSDPQVKHVYGWGRRWSQRWGGPSIA